MDKHIVFIQKSKHQWLRYANPADTISADTVDRVLPALQSVEEAVAAGKYAAGFVAYEAAPAFDSALEVHPPAGSDMPLVWFGIYDGVEELSSLPPSTKSFSLGDWQPSVTEHEYHQAISRIQRYIEAGDTYQVNYTFRLQADFTGDPYSLFAQLAASQRGRNCAFVQLEDKAICSASPELFLAIQGESLKSCPMKGTATRGRTCAEDDAAAEVLRSSEKNRAENIMIVDMIRNDFGRVAKPGTVTADPLFDVERYPTVLQMTSTVRADSSASFVDIMKAMFPCSSITGAPKVRTMQIIRELESSPRGIYTGMIGCLAPGQQRRALFNVAIRTAVIDQQTGTAEYGVGGGIVWDSEGHSEYAECLDKAKVLTTVQPCFELLETLLWSEADGVYLLDEHIDRLSRSAAYFDIPAEKAELTEQLLAYVQQLDLSRARVRMLVDSKGGCHFEAYPQPQNEDATTWRVAIAGTPVDSNDPFLYHKTTHRAVYEAAKAAHSECDDVLLYNEHGEVTESCFANVVIEQDGRRVTPPVSCGLLAGTLRRHLLEKGDIEEATFSLDDLRNAPRIWLINSVRGWIPCQLVNSV